jgi:anti-sigma factor RsiW
MTCRDALAFLSDYRTGDLPRETREVFVRHLEVCPSCRAYLESYERTIALAKSAELGEDPPAPPRELEEAILLSVRRSIR